MDRGRALSVMLLVVGLGFALLGQFYLAYRPEYVWDGVLFWCVAILSFGLLLRRMARLERGQSGGRFWPWIRLRPLRLLAAIGGALLAAAAGWQARRWTGTADFGGLLWLWLIGVAWFLLAFVPSTSVREIGARLAQRVRGNWAELVIGRWPLAISHWSWGWLAALSIVALAVRAVDLEHVPANLGGDEGTQGLAALELLGSPLGNPFSTGWFSVPTLSFLVWGLSMRLFGDSVAGLRVLSALIGTATVLTTARLARELWGRRVAWLAAAALACSHYHIHYSRLGSNQIADGLFVTLALVLLMRGLRTGRGITFALAGAVMGLGWYGYFGARLGGVIVGLYLTWRAVAEYRFLARYGRLLLVLLGAALVVVVPLLLHYADYPQDLVSRSRQVSIFGSGWLAREREITGRSAASLLLQQFWRSVSAFHHTLDPTFWYHPAIPLLDVISGVLLVLGMVWATAHCNWPANGLLLLWFWSALFFGWVVTENPPSSQRLLIIAPALAILVGLGLNWLMVLGRRVIGGALRSWERGGAIVLAAVAALNLYYYFAVYTPTRVYGNPTAEVATELGRSLAQRDDDYVVYFHAPPFMYWGFGTLQFLARGVEGLDVPPPGEGEELEPDLSRGARFVFLPERLNELEAVSARVPGGLELPVYSSADGRLLYVLYEVAPR